MHASIRLARAAAARRGIRMVMDAAWMTAWMLPGCGRARRHAAVRAMQLLRASS
jgi:hypothetical protein